MGDRGRVWTGLIAIGVLAGACNGSRQGASGDDGAADVPVGGSDAGADRADSGADTPAAACQTIAMDATVTSHLKITADNECDVYVNGAKVGTTANWSAAVTIDVSLFLHPGRRNVIAVRGTNTSSQAGNDRGIIGELTVDVDGGVAPLVQTNKDWRAAGPALIVPNPDGGGADWTALDYDDGAWTAAAEIATNGDAPWGSVLGTSMAKWIWLAPVPVDTANKPDLETTYVRRTFYFALDGTTIASTPACPAP
jgi:hypothetical protein